MKALPRTATVKDYQKAVASYAAQSGQTYAVDSSTFAPGKRYAQALEGEPDVPAYFSYLTVPECRERKDTKITSDGQLGRIYNHWQWCGWEGRESKEYKTMFGGPYKIGFVHYRQEVMGWGSQSSSQMTVRLYIDQVTSPAGSTLTPQNTTLTAIPSCTNTFGDGQCAFSQPRYSVPFVDLAAGNIIEIPVTVNLANETSGNPDRITAMNLKIELQVTTSTRPGAVLDGGSYTPAIRCDQSKSGEFNTPACIFSGVQPVYAIGVNDPNVGEVAQHIRWAHTDPDSTTPQTGGQKIIPKLLNRETGEVERKANRDKATATCDRIFGETRPEGKQCDEYPFAASEQGAASREGDSHYSVALIDGKQNEKEGGQRSAWLKYDRIIDHDEFKVVAY